MKKKGKYSSQDAPGPRAHRKPKALLDRGLTSDGRMIDDETDKQEAGSLHDDRALIWMSTAEDRYSANMMTALWEMLEEARVDPDQRLIVWPGNACLTLAETLQRLAECYPGYRRERIEHHLLAWLEQDYDPGEQTQEQRYEWDTKIEQWVAEYEQREPISIPTFFRGNRGS